MKKSVMIALAVVLVAGIVVGGTIFARSSLAKSDQEESQKSKVESEHEQEANKPMEIEDLKCVDATKVSAWVMGEECFSTDEDVVNQMVEITTRLTINELDISPYEEEGIEGGTTQLNLYGETGLLCELMLFSREPQVVQVGRGENYFYCDITKEDALTFQELYEQMYEEFSSELESANE